MTICTDARDFGRFTRSLAAEAFRHHDLRPMRDHDDIIDMWASVVKHHEAGRDVGPLWAERPDFWKGYLECSP